MYICLEYKNIQIETNYRKTDREIDDRTLKLIIEK